MLAYLAARYGMISAGTIEVKAGVDPTPAHLAELEETMRREGVRLVIRERHYPAALAETLANESGAHLAELSVMTGGTPEAKDYISFVNQNLQSLLKAVP